MRSSTKSKLDIDWQHIVLFTLAIVGGVIFVVKPDLSQILGPVLSAIVPLALAKKSPLSSSASSGGGETDNKDVTVINIGVPPKEIKVGEDGDIEVRWVDDDDR